MKRIKKGIWLFSILMVPAFCGLALGAAIYYVDDDPVVGPSDGTTRLGHFLTIQEGLDCAAYGDTVRVLSGTYNEDIELKDGVRLTGGAGMPTIRGYVSADGVGRRTLFDGFTVTQGGMSVVDSTLQIHHCNFELTSSGIRLSRSAPSITDCRFINNYYGEEGGGINMYESDPTIERCYFENNSTGDAYDSPGAGGGAIYISGGSPVIIKDCEFRENGADGGGGAIKIRDAIVGIKNCVFYGNTAGFGGAVEIGKRRTAPMVFIFNSTFHKNEARTSGGAILTRDDAWAVLLNCTLYDNRVTSSYTDPLGGALRNNGTIGVYNSIIWNNTNPQVSSGDDSPPVSIDYCDVEGGYDGEGNIDVDPGFRHAENENFNLRSDSPCIDAGVNLLLTLDTDIDGDERIVDGNEDGIAVVDMGVHEFHPPMGLRGTTHAAIIMK